jgi:hypothetical protein
MTIKTSQNGGFTYNERAVLGNRVERRAKKSIKIRLEVEDNVDGDPASAASCAVTLAAKRRKPGVVAAITGYKITKLIYGDPLTGYYERFHTPKTLSKQLKEFDDPKHPRTAINYEEFTFKPLEDSWYLPHSRVRTGKDTVQHPRVVEMCGGRNRPIFK